MPKDVDLQRNLLIIRQTKFSKSRLVPFGPCMAKSLHQYIECRENKIGEFDPNDPFFSFRKCPINRHTISRTFQSILPIIGVDVQEGVAPPCPHSPQTFLCRRNITQVVPRAERPGPVLAPSLDLHGTCKSGFYFGISDNHRGYAHGSK